MKQVELTSKLVLTLIAVILVTAIVTLPYQNQVANAAPARKYTVDVTLTDVPANAEDLILNVSMFKLPFSSITEKQFKTVSSPSEGQVVTFVLTAPARDNADSVLVCGNTSDLRLSSCELEPLPSRPGNSPIRVDVEFPYPT